MNQLPSNRAAAKAEKSRWYFTGVPCVRGHLAPRFTSIGKCTLCAREDAMKGYVHTTSKRRRVTDTESLIFRAKQVHGDRFEYTRTVFTGAKNYATVTCKKHGDFQIRPDNLVNGKGCKLCKHEGISQRCNAGVDGFVQKAVALHGDRYDYSAVNYVASHTRVEIRCRLHDVAFFQTPTNHLSGKDGCPQCNHTKSAPEEAVASLLSLFTPVEQRNRTLIAPKEVDILMPEKRLAVEYCGEYFHSHGDADHEAKHAMNHWNKYKQCAEKGYRLITVYETEWKERNYAIRRLLRNAIGKSKGKVMARKCELRAVDHKDAVAFYERYHPQGGAGAGEHYGLYWAGKLVACMRFTEGANDRGNNRKREWTLTRYATRVTVTGGASRLFNAFLKDKNPKTVKSFSDNRFFAGGMYEQLGFVLAEDTKPDYQVWHPKLGLLPKPAWQRRSLPLRAKTLGIELDYDPDTDPRTERDITYLLGARRIYDCGKKRWVWTKP